MHSRVQLICAAVAALFVAACSKQRPSSNLHLRKSASSSCMPRRYRWCAKLPVGLRPRALRTCARAFRECCRSAYIRRAAWSRRAIPSCSSTRRLIAPRWRRPPPLSNRPKPPPPMPRSTADRNRELAKQNLVSRMQLDDAAGARAIHRRAGVRGPRAGADRAHQSRLRHHHLADLRPRRPDARARRRAGRAGRGDAANYRRTGRSHFRVLRSAGVRLRAAACARRLRAT